MRKLLNWLFGVKAEVASTPATPEKKAMSINKGLLARSGAIRESTPIKPYLPVDGVVPENKLDTVLAMDATPYDYVNKNESFAYQFAGYPRLAQLSQVGEYRNVVSTIAEEMTRKWIEVVTTGDEDKSNKIKKITDALTKLKAQEVFKQALEHDGFYGRGQIYIETKMPSGGLSTDDPVELETLLSLSEKKMKKGSLVALRTVEPIWTYPQAYQSQNPLGSDYFKPSGWYVMGKAVHSSRLLTLVLRPVPDMLKPSYNFGGLPLTQIIEAYVNNWQRTRDSVSDLIHSFSLTILKTNMANILAGSPASDLFDRIDLFNNTRDNRGAMAIDMNDEDIVQINTPISGMDKLQAQAQEQLASIARIPLVKLLGVQPSGLNASSDGEIRTFYDSINSMQTAVMLEPLKRIISLVQLSEFGEIDESITLKFVPLYQLTESEDATVKKTEAETDSTYIQAGVLAPDEVRQRLASDLNSPYHGLDINAEIEDPNDEEAENIRSENQDDKANSNAKTDKG